MVDEDKYTLKIMRPFLEKLWVTIRTIVKERLSLQKMKKTFIIK